MSALLGPEPRGLDLGQPIDHPSQDAEQQRLKHANQSGEKRHRRDIAAHTAGAGPQEGEKPSRQGRRCSIRVGCNEILEVSEQGWRLRLTASRSYRSAAK